MSDPMLREAAERYLAGEYHRPEHGYSPEAVHDLGILAEAWIADNPADDGEPVDESWLRSVGFESHLGAWFSRRSSKPGPVCRLSHDPRFGCDSWHIEDGEDGDEGVGIPPLETRGDVRRLCAALAIPLPPTPAAAGEGGE